MSLAGARGRKSTKTVSKRNERTDDDFVRCCCFLFLHFSHFLPPAQNEINASSALLCALFPVHIFFATKEGIFHTRFLSSTPHLSQSHVKGLWGEGLEEKGSDFFVVPLPPLPPRPSASAPPRSPVSCAHTIQGPPKPTNSFSLRRIRFLLLHLDAPNAKAFSRHVIHPPSGSRLVRFVVKGGDEDPRIIIHHDDDKEKEGEVMLA